VRVEAAARGIFADQGPVFGLVGQPCGCIVTVNVLGTIWTICEAQERGITDLVDNTLRFWTRHVAAAFSWKQSDRLLLVDLDNSQCVNEYILNQVCSP
jgi:hypothetical protein